MIRKWKREVLVRRVWLASTPFFYLLSRVYCFVKAGLSYVQNTVRLTEQIPWYALTKTWITYEDYREKDVTVFYFVFRDLFFSVLIHYKIKTDREELIWEWQEIRSPKPSKHGCKPFSRSVDGIILSRHKNNTNFEN